VKGQGKTAGKNTQHTALIFGYLAHLSFIFLTRERILYSKFVLGE
jgi:hypothetical protein